MRDMHSDVHVVRSWFELAHASTPDQVDYTVSTDVPRRRRTTRRSRHTPSKHLGHPTSFGLMPAISGGLGLAPQDYSGVMRNQMVRNQMVKIPQALGLGVADDGESSINSAPWWRYDFKGKLQLRPKLKYRYLQVEKASGALETKQKSASLACTGAEQCRRKCFESITGNADGVNLKSQQDISNMEGNTDAASASEKDKLEKAKLKEENQGRRLRACIDEVDRRERNMMHNFFQYTVGNQGPPCKSYCSERDVYEQAKRGVQEGIVKLSRKVDYMKYQIDKLKLALPRPDPKSLLEAAQKAKGAVKGAFGAAMGDAGAALDWLQESTTGALDKLLVEDAAEAAEGAAEEVAEDLKMPSFPKIGG
eukprot:g8061.t1